MQVHASCDVGHQNQLLAHMGTIGQGLVDDGALLKNFNDYVMAVRRRRHPVQFDIFSLLRMKRAKKASVRKSGDTLLGKDGF